MVGSFGDDQLGMDKTSVHLVSQGRELNSVKASECLDRKGVALRIQRDEDRRVAKRLPQC